MGDQISRHIETAQALADLFEVRIETAQALIDELIRLAESNLEQTGQVKADLIITDRQPARSPRPCTSEGIKPAETCGGRTGDPPLLIIGNGPYARRIPAGRIRPLPFERFRRWLRRFF